MNGLNIFCFIMNIAVALLAGVLLPIVPALTRKSFLFGVKVPPGQSGCEEARAMKRRYTAICAAGTAVMLGVAIAQFAALPDWTFLMGMYFPLLFAAVQLAAFIPSHSAALRLKEGRGWQISDAAFTEAKTSFTRGSLSNLPWAWYAASLAVVIASAAAALVQYQNMPDVIPTHWGFDMEPNAWRDKSYGEALLMPILNFAMTAVMLVAGAVPIEKAKLQIDADNPALSFAQHRAYRKRMGNVMGLLALCLAVLFMLLGFQTIFPGFTLPFWLVLAIPVAPSIWACAAAVKMGQGGCKIKLTAAEAGSGGTVPGEGWAGAAKHADDRLWALGMFYHNPDDPAILVENRFGGNIGFNYSRLPVRIGVATGVAAIVALYVWCTVWWFGFIAAAQ